MWLLEEEAHTEGARNASNFPIKSVIYGSGAAVKAAAAAVCLGTLSPSLSSRSRVYVMPVVPLVIPLPLLITVPGRGL